MNSFCAYRKLITRQTFAKGPLFIGLTLNARLPTTEIQNKRCHSLFWYEVISPFLFNFIAHIPLYRRPKSCLKIAWKEQNSFPLFKITM